VAEILGEVVCPIAAALAGANGSPAPKPVPLKKDKGGKWYYTSKVGQVFLRGEDGAAAALTLGELYGAEKPLRNVTEKLPVKQPAESVTGSVKPAKRNGPPPPPPPPQKQEAGEQVQSEPVQEPVSGMAGFLRG